MITVYITCNKEAEKIARMLLAKKLIACANTFPVSSLYKWQGKIEKSREMVVICKTRKENFSKIAAEVKKVHSYKVPCIVALPWLSSSADYAKWVREET